MPLTEEQEERLNFMFSELEANSKSLNSWEQGFLKDNIDRYQKYKAGISLSPKQWSVLNRMYEKVTET